MAILSSLFNGDTSASNRPGRKTIEPDTGSFTTGNEEILFPLLQVAFTPPAGWSPYTGIVKEQKSSEVRVANPSLMGSAGVITGRLYPADGLTLADRVDQLIGKSSDRVVERSVQPTDQGLDIAFLHLAGTPADSETVRHTVFCCFLNGAGQIVSLQCVGTTEANALATAASFLRTLRLAPVGV